MPTWVDPHDWHGLSPSHTSPPEVPLVSSCFTSPPVHSPSPVELQTPSDAAGRYWTVILNVWIPAIVLLFVALLFI